MCSEGLKVAQSDQRTHACAAFVDYLHADANALRRQTGIEEGISTSAAATGFKFVSG